MCTAFSESCVFCWFSLFTIAFSLNHMPPLWGSVSAFHCLLPIADCRLNRLTSHISWPTAFHYSRFTISVQVFHASAFSRLLITGNWLLVTENMPPLRGSVFPFIAYCLLPTDPSHVSHLTSHGFSTIHVCRLPIHGFSHISRLASRCSTQSTSRLYNTKVGTITLPLNRLRHKLPHQPGSH